jgi:hypothetical protein
MRNRREAQSDREESEGIDWPDDRYHSLIDFVLAPIKAFVGITVESSGYEFDRRDGGARRRDMTTVGQGGGWSIRRIGALFTCCYP